MKKPRILYLSDWISKNILFFGRIEVYSKTHGSRGGVLAPFSIGVENISELAT